MLTVLQDDLRDRSKAALGEHLLEEVERPARDRFRLQVVGLLHETSCFAVRRDRHKLLDLYRANCLERHRGEVVVRYDHVLAWRHLVAADRVTALDEDVVRWAVSLHLDSAVALAMEHVEAHALRF